MSVFIEVHVLLYKVFPVLWLARRHRRLGGDDAVCPKGGTIVVHNFAEESCGASRLLRDQRDHGNPRILCRTAGMTAISVGCSRKLLLVPWLRNTARSASPH